MSFLSIKFALLISIFFTWAGVTLADDLVDAKEMVRCTKKFWWTDMPTTEIDLHKKVSGEYIVMADEKHIYFVDGQSRDVVGKMKVREKSHYNYRHGLGIRFSGFGGGVLPSIVKNIVYDIERRMITFENYFLAGESFFHRGLSCHDVRGDVGKFMNLFNDKEKKNEQPLPKKVRSKMDDLEIIYFGHAGSIKAQSEFLASRCNVVFEQESGLDSNSTIHALQSWSNGSDSYGAKSMAVSHHIELCQYQAQRFIQGYLNQSENPNADAKKQLNLIPTIYAESNLQGLNPFERAILNPEPVTGVKASNQWLCVAFYNQSDFWPGGGASGQIQWRISGEKHHARASCDQLLANYQIKYIDPLDNPVQFYRSYLLELVVDQHQ